MDITHTNHCPHGRTDGLACYGHTDPARDCPPPCCEVHRDGSAQPLWDCPECTIAMAHACRTMMAPPFEDVSIEVRERRQRDGLGDCEAPGCRAEAGPLPGPRSGRDLCPEHRDDERHDLERTA